jgi:hypothetical protein
LLKKIIKHKDRNDPDNIHSFHCEIYDKIQIDLNNVSERFQKRRLLKQFQFVFNNIDTNAVTGKAYLPILISETQSDFYYQRQPKEEKEIINATQVSGVKDQSISQFTGRMTQSFNVYDNFMTFFQSGFISPISDFGLLYYHYYLIDSAFIDGRWCYHMSFNPMRKQELTFSGDFWVVDTVFAIKKIQMRLNKDANINFINELVASYDYQPYKDSLWYLSYEELLVDFNITDTKKITGFFGHKYTYYRNYTFGEPIAKNVLDLKTDIVVSDSALDKSKEYWEEARPIRLSQREEKVYKMVDSIKEVPLYQTFADIVNLFASYYYQVGDFEFGPYYTVYSYNEIEGNRFRIGGRTSNQFSTRLMLTGHLAYGTEDEKFKYGLEGVYMLGKNPRRVLGAIYKEDIEQLGQSVDAFKTDNILSSLLRRNANYKLTMVHNFNGYYEHEWYQGFSNSIIFNHRTLYGTQYIPLAFVVNGDTINRNKLVSSEFTLQTHFAYKEKFVMGEFDRMSIGTEYPVIDLFLTKGIKNLFQSQYDYYKVNVQISHYFNTNPFGYLSYQVNAGRIFGKLPYPLLELHKGNETYAFDNSAFNMMNYYEFVSDKYVSLFAEQHFQGFFLNGIPLIRKLKWREILYFRGLIGSLDAKNKSDIIFPQGLSEVNKPYCEVGVGVENIFKILRIDVIRRLSYLDHKNIQILGIRAKLQITL